MKEGVIISIAIASLVVTLITGGLAIYFYLKSRREKEPVWAFDTRILLGGELPSNFKVMYGSEEVKKVVETRFVFWNKGREVIRPVDILPEDPIRLCFKDSSRVFEVEEVVKSRPQIGTGYKTNLNTVLLSFRC